MRVRHLSLSHFRNYDRLDLDLAPGVTVLYGDNAQGKSNLLEAIFYLATTRSFRAGNDRELLAWALLDDPISFTRIAAQVERSNEPFEIEVILRQDVARVDDVAAPPFSKRIKLNDIPRRSIDVIGMTTAVMFSPQDLELVDGAPLLRRRYLDVTISQADRAYCRGLAHYNRVILQRNHLLRAIRDRGSPTDQLHFWNGEMVSAGSLVTARRRTTIRQVGEIAQRLYRELSGSTETLNVGYKSSIFSGAVAIPEDPNDISQAFEARLVDVQARDVANGVSLVGPHRDDLTFQIDGHDLSTFGSRGQQRTAALALKLAEAEHLAEQIGERPVLLLDDVLSELDAHRRARVLAFVQNDQQVLLTTTDRASLEGLLPANAVWLQVRQGRLSKDDLADPAPTGRGTVS
ncbi:MAG TPA: DNA replication/repair protein RecF [Chloroflexota bacterium]|nr:DNA replication/repair protein RecF [Chloroflexota bacterium]